MNPFEMVVAIVVIVTIGSVVRTLLGGGRSRRNLDLPLRPDDGGRAENERLRAELLAMKERLAVLERLATDNNASSANLDREIEKLRDRT